ncbi:MAG: response regulator [Bacteriovoracaceae bacterium]
MDMNGKMILVVDDEFDLREIMASEFDFLGAKVFQAENVNAAIKILESNSIDLVISDIRMPGATGIDLLNAIKIKNIVVPPIVLITGFADITLEDAFNRGAEALINKPFKLDDLIETSFRLLQTPSERWSSEMTDSKEKLSLSFSEKFSEVIGKGDLLIGRGGVSLHFDGVRDHIEVNDRIEFEFKFSDITVSGVGICRWVRGHETENRSRTYIGIEFYYLKKESLEVVSHFIGQNKTLSFIPAQPQKS